MSPGPGSGAMVKALLEGLLARARKKSARDVLQPTEAPMEGEPDGDEGALSDEELAELLGEEPSEENLMGE